MHAGKGERHRYAPSSSLILLDSRTPNKSSSQKESRKTHIYRKHQDILHQKTAKYQLYQASGNENELPIPAGGLVILLFPGSLGGQRQLGTLNEVTVTKDVFFIP